MKSPRYWALQQIHVLLQYPHKDVEMKSPRHWALQPKVLIHQDNDIKSRNEKPEVV